MAPPSGYFTLNRRMEESPVPSDRSRRIFYIKGGVVGLAEFLLEDYRLFYETWKDPSTQRNFNFSHDWESFGDFLRMFTDPDRPPQRFDASIVRLQDQVPVGRCSLAPTHLEPDLAVWIYESFRFKGYGTEAVQLSVDFSFAELDIDYIVAGIYEYNQASIDLFTKIGFFRAPELDRVEESVFGEGKITHLGFRINRPNPDLEARKRSLGG